ncbi:hypothetical protein CYLTODRAFT_363558 [Cylindrobasidium torrendii FP15055 ss-10]|uniref:Retrotransposon gag domain-containing protein n=1 Tax=Cylindrobasidium torrendii FP15055 ss-10 TaxID=1314674 RepID=A0A0D7ASC6_9AGAR|nr:hypothetical protein CYLTODRAFT_363558 [Cylindrobasidium torrendii FP15055 ss-10]
MDTFVQSLATPHTSADSKIVPRPERFSSGAAATRAFITQFKARVSSCGFPLNDANKARVEGQWMIFFLALMTGEAAQWAAPHLTKLTAHFADPTNITAPFTSFDACKKAFFAQFLVADDAQQAVRELSTLTQGKLPVPVYTTRFADIASCTALFDADLMVRLRAGLSAEAKHWVALSSLITEPTTLTELICVADKADFTMRSANPSAHSSQSADPYAMDIDATRTGSSGRSRDDFVRAMRGCCYGCGSNAHNKRNGNHGLLVCSHCKRTGHKAEVCQDKFLGVPAFQGQRRKPAQCVAAAAADVPFSLFP